jgi:uncharacterized protein
VFKRKLTKKEVNVIKKIILFVEDKMQECEGHDYSHVLEVCKHSIEIGKKIKEEADPFVLIAGALLHDIGRVGSPAPEFHAIDGGARAEEFLESLLDDSEIIRKITRVVVRHSYRTMIPPRTPEEKIVFDADDIERLGFMGMMRGIMGKKGSIEEIIEDRINKRVTDFGKLNYRESKELAEKLHKETIQLVHRFKTELNRRLKDINEIESYKLLREVE